jgi:hypothetical protein
VRIVTILALVLCGGCDAVQSLDDVRASAGEEVQLGNSFDIWFGDGVFGQNVMALRDPQAGFILRATDPIWILPEHLKLVQQSRSMSFERRSHSRERDRMLTSTVGKYMYQRRFEWQIE